MSSGCVFRNLFKCEKKCDTVASRKALLQEFTSKVYNAEVVYVDNEGKTTDEEYTILFRSSETQKDKDMISVHGNAFLQFGEDTPIKASWSGHYLEKKHGYKMKLVGDNIEKDFYLYCDGNETINFLSKKTAPELGSGSVSEQSGVGTLSSLEKQLSDSVRERQVYNNKQDSSNFSSLSNSQQNTIINQVIQLNGKIGVLQLQILSLYYTANQTVSPKLIPTAQYLCYGNGGGPNGENNYYNFCKDPNVKYNIPNDGPGGTGGLDILIR